LIFFNRYPYGHDELAVCEDFDQVRGAMEKYPAYQGIFAKLSFGESQMLDKAFYEEEVKRLTLTFEQQVCITLSHLSMLFFLAWPQHMQVTSLWNCLHAQLLVL
jgi:hypothetical protein